MQFVHMRILRLTLDVRAQLVKWLKPKKNNKVAERKANQKNADHPVFDPQTRRRLHPFDFCALSFERHGFWAKETISFTKKLAYARASALGLDPSAEICRWYGIISCCIQRANAKVLRGEPVPARHSPPPVRLFSINRDLIDFARAL